MKGYGMILLMFVIAVSEPRRVIASDVPKCECGAFKFSTPESTDQTPILSKALQFNFECSKEGMENCSNMCKALAEASKEGPKKLCEVLENTEEPLMPAIYYRACDENNWSYTGLTSSVEICCKNKEIVPCA